MGKPLQSILLFLNPLFFPQRAKRVIFIFMAGGPSHVDTFDYKPELFAKDGKQIDFVGVRTNTFGKASKRTLMKPLWKFKRYGECGQYVSSLFPNIAKHVDDLAFIHSMHTEESPMVHRHYLCIPEPPTWYVPRWAVGFLTGLERRIKTSLLLLPFLHLQARVAHEIIAMLFYHPFIRVRQLAVQEM